MSAGRFRKPNATGYPDALQREAQGLELLRAALQEGGVTGVSVPRVHAVDQRTLELTEIVPRRGSPELQAVLGRAMAALHRSSAAGYGLEYDNYIGLAPQRNEPCASWGSFFVDRRLRDQVARIRDRDQRRRFAAALESHSAWLVDFLDHHCQQPSLLHGDLWAGNVLYDQERAWLIDPAVYFGDREADIAMTELFGGFTPDFYQAYDAAWPRSDAYRHKRVLYNLYHYLNHYNLFGSAYLGSCEAGFRYLQRVAGTLA